MARGNVGGVMAAYLDPLTQSVAGLPGIPMARDEPWMPTTPPPPPALTVPTLMPLPGSASVEGQATCGINEELFLGQCYAKCADLTNGTFPVRIAPNGCCKTSSLLCLNNAENDFSGLLPGSGYMVSGNGGAPHMPGICDGNEEQMGGMCYKKCELLSDGKFPIRSGPNTCCKAKPCWNIFNVESAGFQCSGYGVGGGLVPDHKCPHPATQV
eukprot:SRR837773.10807.p2 GENE.SRR837773.10807~~SRR837773.10807.p2  ORF type:complete len:212 (-),score=73.04 SRR837773.10807:39-674(-)